LRVINYLIIPHRQASVDRQIRDQVDLVQSENRAIPESRIRVQRFAVPEAPIPDGTLTNLRAGGGFSPKAGSNGIAAI
jgi:hypothetical protein